VLLSIQNDEMVRFTTNERVSASLFCIIIGHRSVIHCLQSFIHICQVTVWPHGNQDDVELSQHPQHCRKDKHFISAPINLQISAIRPANQCNSTGKKYKCIMCGALLAISGNDTCSPFLYFKTVSNVLFHSSY
jgi:hypothetical protein